MPVPPEDVRAAYRLLLGREPESEAVVSARAAATPDLAALRASFLGAPEFCHANAREILRFMTGWAATRRHEPVETACSPEDLARLIAHVRRVWSRLGEEEPHFSVMSHAAYKPAHIAATLPAFLATGKAEAEMLAAELAGHGLKTTGWSHCVELGCGVGRVTRHLAGFARQVTGLDVSAPHLALARAHLAEERVGNVTLAQIEDPAGLVLPDCDLLYSRIVLQHNPPPVMLFLLRRMLAALRPGGVAVFQLPVFLDGYRFVLAEYLAVMDAIEDQELHALPQAAVFRAIAEAGCTVLACYRDNSLARITQVSNRFILHRPSASP
ncbi:class I SAM-dependent methyltransferase [Roseomonas sp. AR75]|uniref:class I SAM-dependent methyltransferase n=1 Tax=Roseomonas sp. AR75 TaxID=2562311 RepID=UPI0010C0B9EC|nr:class I SAM-dependent methyltransferase [Roseomonas sp. AR75]